MIYVVFIILYLIFGLIYPIYMLPNLVEDIGDTENVSSKVLKLALYTIIFIFAMTLIFPISVCKDYILMKNN